MCDECQNNKKGILGGLIVGGTIASGLFFLFGTEKGKKFQKEIKKRGEQAVEDLQELMADLEEKGLEYKEKAKVVAREVKQQVGDKLGDGGEVAKREIGAKLDKAITAIESAEEGVSQATKTFHEGLRQKLLKK